MKTLYLDCSMGAAGDMLCAALLELLPDPDAFVDRLNALPIPGVRYEKKRAVKCGVAGTRLSVTVNGVEECAAPDADAHDHHPDRHDHHADGHDHHPDGHDHHPDGHDHHPDGHDHHPDGHGHAHNNMDGVARIAGALGLPERVYENVMAVYALIAEAESRAHGVPVADIHFHEVGTMDAIADVTAACLLMDAIAPDEVVVSPVHVGSGHVRCAHGVLPVPAPATAYILQGVPIYGGAVRGELCTPTGAALLRRFATRFGDMPAMRTTSIGYGMGSKDFERVNCVRALLGETRDCADVVLELSCNVDDMTAEAVGFAMERLFAGGAREVYTEPAGMKKSRPGTLLRVICAEQDRDAMLRLIFAHTTTLGVREAVMRRHILARAVRRIKTPYGVVRVKTASGYGVSRAKAEYEDLARIARERNISLAEAEKLVAPYAGAAGVTDTGL